MKKLISLLLVLALLCVPCAALAYDLDSLHTAFKDKDSVYGGNNYLFDTLTLAGSGMGGVFSYTVMDLETMAADESLGLRYENTYSLMTSGKVFSQALMTGLRLYDLLLACGMDETLSDDTPVKCISKDGYTIAFTLGAIRDASRYARYRSMDDPIPEETGLPVMIAFGSNHLPLVGPTGDEPAYKLFTEAEGYSEEADNVGGPIRLVLGQTDPTEFNAPNCSKWLSAVVVGDPDGYVYSRDTGAEIDDSEPDQDGDWTHAPGTMDDYTLTITGSESSGTAKLSIYELEALRDLTLRQYFACSTGKNAYEGVILRELIKKHLAPGLDVPSSVTIVAEDGYSKAVDLDGLMNGIDSHYQPGKHREMLLAYAIDGAPMVREKESDGYNGSNAYGPVRLVVENTVSAWVKTVVKIIIGEERSYPFTDMENHPWAKEAVAGLYERGVVNGTGEGRFSPGKNIKRGDFILMLYRAAGFAPDESAGCFDDVPEGSYYRDAIAAMKAKDIARGTGAGFSPEAVITRQDAMTLIYRTLRVLGSELPEGGLAAFPDASEVAGYAEEAVDHLTAAGIINGKNGVLDPRATMTRAEMAAALYRALELFPEA